MDLHLHLSDDLADLLAARASRLGISVSEHSQILLSDLLSGKSTADRVADLVKAVDSLSGKVGGLAGVAADLHASTTDGAADATSVGSVADGIPAGATAPAGTHRDPLSGKIIRFQASDEIETPAPAKPGSIRTASGRVLTFHH